MHRDVRSESWTPKSPSCSAGAWRRIVFGEISTGVQDDLLKATDIARVMVKPLLARASLQRKGTAAASWSSSKRALPGAV